MWIGVYSEGVDGSIVVWLVSNQVNRLEGMSSIGSKRLDPFGFVSEDKMVWVGSQYEAPSSFDPVLWSSRDWFCSFPTEKSELAADKESLRQRENKVEAEGMYRLAGWVTPLGSEEPLFFSCLCPGELRERVLSGKTRKDFHLCADIERRAATGERRRSRKGTRLGLGFGGYGGG